MAWLRLDDGFTNHPKFEGWAPQHRWAWLQVMEYCARYRTRGRIPTDETLLPRSTTKQLLAKAEAAGWCAREDDGALWINDWETFNPPRGEEVEQAVKEAVEADPEASANEIFKRVGGNRNQVLDAIRRYRAGTEPVSRSGISGVVPVPVSRAHPVPSRPEVPPKAVPVASNEPEPEPSLTDDDPADNDRTAFDQFIDTVELREMP